MENHRKQLTPLLTGVIEKGRYFYVHFRSQPATQRHFLPFFRFLDVLAARKDPSGLMGKVLIDGAPQPPNFKCLSGYVVQVS